MRTGNPGTRFGFRATCAAVVLLALTLGGCTTLKTPTFAKEGAAIRGYDPVAYHVESKPVKGKAEYSLVHNGAVWYFASEENRGLFSREPDRYAPEYGGYCAYAMSKGYVVSTDPDAWHIEDGTLYLNYSPGVRETWLKDIPGYVEKADRNWAEKLARQDFE